MKPSALIGRSRELEELLSGVAAAKQGSGTVFVVSGQPGIGKSRLVDEVARRATAEGLGVAFGRSWESGGAPAYWPWIQVVREAARLHALSPDALSARSRTAAQLLPEWSDQGGPPLSVDPEQARFRLLDGVTALLCELARKAPLLVAVEDAHAADNASLLLLDFLSDHVRAERLVLIVTCREAEGALGRRASPLLRVARRARSLRLGPLGRADACAVVEELCGSAPDERSATEIMEMTEGNPLFVTEVARHLLAHGALPAAALLGASVRELVGERLRAASPESRRALDVASVLGREFSRPRLARLLDLPEIEVAVRLGGALDAALVEEPSPGQYRFSHILFRETIYHALSQDERERLHLSVAESLSDHDPTASSAELSHHYLRGGATGRARVKDVARRAGHEALEQYAFEEAAFYFELALASTLAGQAPPREAGDLLLELAQAQMLAGQLELGRRTCERAAALARDMNDPSTLARAALEYGRHFLIAQVNPRLVELLREALQALPERDGELRALTMARLAAAEQPAKDPHPPMEMARAAVAMARNLGDPRTLLETIRSASSALMDLADPAERERLNQEQVRLAERLGDQVEQFRGHARLSFDLQELGDTLGARAAIEACTRLAERLGQPQLQWQAASFLAMQALFEGRFDDASRHRAKARALGARAADPNADKSLRLQEFEQLRVRGEFEQLAAMIPQVEADFAADANAALLANVIACGALARSGRAPEVRAHLRPDALESVLAVGDRTLLEALADVATTVDDAAMARRVLASFSETPSVLVNGGLMGRTWGGPVARALGCLRAYLGDMQQARRDFELARRTAETAKALPQLAWCAYDEARWCSRDPASLEQQRALLEQSLEIAERLGMPGLVRAARDTLAAAGGAAPREGRPALASAAAPIELAREGEVWTLRCGQVSLKLRDGRGTRILAMLVADPYREFHALELMEATPARGLGDAGEVLDEAAKLAYRQRIRELESEIDEAESHHDQGRLERLRAELSFVGDELGRCLGLGGRTRRAGSAAERARVNVQRRLKAVLEKIAKYDAALGRRLSRSIRTGTFCSYEPE